LNPRPGYLNPGRGGERPSCRGGARRRKPVEDYLLRQGRLAHPSPEDIKYFHDKVDECREKCWIPGIVTFGPKAEE
jgi:hypothetical protein